MKILIIGGTGLISTPLTRFLLERGDDVTHFNRGQQQLYTTPVDVNVIQGDRTDYPAFEQQMAAAGHFDCVIDMIGYVPRDAESAVRAFRGRTEHFIFCSTVDVYRKPASHYPVTEAEGYGGLNAYSSNKVVCEQILRVAYEHEAFPLTIIRPAYTYGEGRGPIHSLGGRTTYLDRMRKGKPLIVHGDGSAFWTACYRDDVARAFAEAVGQAHTVGKSYHTPGEEWMTWDTYHGRVAEALGVPLPQLVHIPTDTLARLAPQEAAIVVENFQFSNIFDTTAARHDLKFRYTVPWVEGVRRMVTWLDEHGRIEDSDAAPFEDHLIAAWRHWEDHAVQELDKTKSRTA
ncbi:MAG: NAD-dependent epimerase/dehydratase family protein [Herpetosiphonaceae bacterium]|nr:NAD-dependent epimerase/dehydratase family protein [Herpetosiphonaceae bacterium]